MVSNWLRRHPSLVDVLIVLTLATVFVGRPAKFRRSTAGVPLAVFVVAALIVLTLAPVFVGRAARFGPGTAGVPLAVLEVAPLLVRRRFPLPVLVVVTAATCVDAAIYPTTVPLAASIAVYTVAAHLDRR